MTEQEILKAAAKLHSQKAVARLRKKYGKNLSKEMSRRRKLGIERKKLSTTDI